MGHLARSGLPTLPHSHCCHIINPFIDQAYMVKNVHVHFVTGPRGK